MNEELLAELPRYAESTAFTSAEKAALRLADLMAGDHRKVTDEVFDELRRHFTEKQILELSWRVAMFIGYGPSSRDARDRRCRSLLRAAAYCVEAVSRLIRQAFSVARSYIGVTAANP